MGEPARESNLGPLLLHVAWMAIVLGLAIQLVLLAVASYAGNAPTMQGFVAELTQKMSWSAIVCTGVAVGRAVGKQREGAMALSGLLAAPLGFTIARTVQSSVSQALKVAGGAPGLLSPVLIGSLRGIEYAFLGWLLGKVSKNPRAGAAAHLGAGLAAGVVFGGTLVLLTVRAATEPPSAAALVNLTLNEVLFPVGCALVLFTANRVSARA